MMEFRDFEPMFGQAKAERANPSSVPLHPFLFHVHAPDSSSLRIHVTDFHSSTWEAVRSVQQLDDMRDCIGIGGTWGEFINYVIDSIKSEDVKVVVEGHSESDGATRAKLIAQKSKGMPLIVISLTKLVDSAASEAMANVSLNLFEAFKNTRSLLVQEEKHSRQLMEAMSAEQEKRESMENQMELFSNRRKLQRVGSFGRANVPANMGSDAMPVSGLQSLPDKLVARDVGTTKLTNRVVPTHRRAKVRGAVLHDAEDDKDN